MNRSTNLEYIVWIAVDYVLKISSKKTVTVECTLNITR